MSALTPGPSPRPGRGETDLAGGVPGPEAAPRGASGEGSDRHEPTSSANLDGTRGSAPGEAIRDSRFTIVEACEHLWEAHPVVRECSKCHALQAVLL